MLFVPFFTRDKGFYRTLVHLMLVVVLQNVVAYSVNMADNLMLGAYSQASLSGAATVNMIQFVFQSVVNSLGEGLVILSSQYWGQGRREPVRRLAGIALTAAFAVGLAVTAATSLFPRQIVGLFTPDEEIIRQGVAYLELIRFTYVLFALSAVLNAVLRTIGSVNVTFGVSVLSLAVDVGINYALIFGRFGMPEMGIRGASVGTLAARLLEVLVLAGYLAFRDQKLRMFGRDLLRPDRGLARDYFRVARNVVTSSVLWALATPIQTGILGHLTADAIAANSVSTTLYQYLKVVTQGEASAAAVIVGRAVGEGDLPRLRSYCRTLQAIFLGIGVCLGVALYFVRIPLLSLYELTPAAREMANGILILLCFVMVGMAYEMPVGAGIIRGGGDTRYSLVNNLISTWGIVMPLSFAAAFWFKWPVVAVVACLNSDQIFKCIPAALWANSYRWVRHLTQQEGAKETNAGAENGRLPG